MTALRPLLFTSLFAVLAGVSTTFAQKPTEADALAVLASSADVHTKAAACRDLAVVGGESAVPALAALLEHEQLADYARSGLEAIPHPSAGAALRAALPQLEGRLLAGVINSLGVRREKAAVPDLQRLARNAKGDAATEAVASLGMIGTTDAASVLKQILRRGAAELRLPAAHALLVAAGHLAREGRPADARDACQAIVRAKPSAHLVAVAQNQAATLARR